MSSPFATRYGAWAVVAGASEGLGAAFAYALAARGCHLLLLARRAEVLATLAEAIAAKHSVTVRTLACDLADASFPEKLAEATAGLEVGLGVYNAAYSFAGPVLERPVEDALRVVEVNCKGPLRFAHALVPRMIARKRGGLVLMSSIAGFQGAPRIATYAASKAFNISLGEGLAAELRPHGVDVVVSCPGAIRTPNYAKAARKEAPGTLDAEVVAEVTLDALGGGAIVIPGAVNKLAAFFLGTLIPRSAAVAIMGKNTADLE
ncbi:MAG TPA: SDR family NAD(P)-dependent oxidoreductase [Polyangiaceae bacterium]